MNSLTGETKDLKANGYTLGVNASIGLSGKSEIEEVENWSDAEQPRGRLLLSAGLRGREIVPDPLTEGAFLNRDRLYGGGRLAWGVPQKFELNLEGVYQHSDYTDGRDDQYFTVVGSVDYRLSEKLWLGAKIGSSFGSSVANDATFIGTTFKFAFGER